MDMLILTDFHLPLVVEPKLGAPSDSSGRPLGVKSEQTTRKVEFRCKVVAKVVSATGL